MPDGSQVLPRLDLKEEDGHFTGTTRFRGGPETAVTNLTVTGNAVSFQVVRERNGQAVVTRYAGTLDGDIIRGKIVADWGGAEKSYDWEARRVVGPEGTWKWTTLGFGGSRAESKLVLKLEGEKLTGKLTAARLGENDISHGKFKDGRLSFEVEKDREGEKYLSRFSGRLAGKRIVGKTEVTFAGRSRTNAWLAVRVE